MDRPSVNSLSLYLNLSCMPDSSSRDGGRTMTRVEQLDELNHKFRDGLLTAGEYCMLLVSFLSEPADFYGNEKLLYHIADCLDLRHRTGCFTHPYYDLKKGE